MHPDQRLTRDSSSKCFIKMLFLNRYRDVLTFITIYTLNFDEQYY